MNEIMLPLNVLLTKRCNANCMFCVEKTVEDTKDNLTWRDYTTIINQMIDEDMVTDVLLLGGEPLYVKGIIDLIHSLKKPPIITTNAHRLVHDKGFREEFSKLPIKAVNISLPHYDDNGRSELMGSYLFSNRALQEALQHLPFSLRVNTLLIKGYIDNVSEIERLANWCIEMGVTGLKVAELTARRPEIHDFIRNEVIEFNRDHYIPIPDPKLRETCYKEGGTVFWREISGCSVFFNAPPDKALSGGKDRTGNFYHRVLFNDGLLGYSWRRADHLLLSDDL